MPSHRESRVRINRRALLKGAAGFGGTALLLPETKFLGIPQDMKQNRSPFAGLQFYGIGQIDGKTGALTMSLHDVEGKRLYSVDLEPEA